jgi:NADH dehydrogenase
VEVAGALAELLDVAVGHDGFNFDRRSVRIIIVDGVDRLLTPFTTSAGSYAATTLEGRGVELKFGRMVRSVDQSCVELDDGTQIPTRTVVWAGGVTVENTVASRLGIPAGPNGRLVVDQDLSIGGRTDAYAVGDAAAVPWAPHSGRHPDICPQLAQVAIQSGRHAAAQVLLRIEGRPTEPFHYHDKGIMATIGRRAAVTQFPRGAVIRGTLGWLAWLGLHLVYLIGYRNRIVVLVNWSWRYLSWGSGPRVIVNDELEQGNGSDPADPADPADHTGRSG